MNGKIEGTHLQRRAMVYLRQSTVSQVMHNQESTRRQYDLRHRAVELGWAPEAVKVIDEDLGCSGATTSERHGFQRLGEAVADGGVGAIFALEVSRLSRRSSDWHRLLDLCRLADVVIVDEQSVYSLRDFNDQLLLGLKGTMAEAERNWLRLRMEGGKLQKAKRGELRLRPPTGYVWDRSAKAFRKDPDERVRAALSLLFERVRVEPSAGAVARYFDRHELRLPARQSDGTIRWSSPSPSAVARILHNPVYAGAYVYGRRRVRTALVDGQVRTGHTTQVAREDWKVFLPDHHPAYIAWEEYVANEKKLHDNRTCLSDPSKRGAPREGAALLQGIALCGRCGRRMETTYPSHAKHPVYQCRAERVKTGRAGPHDWHASAGRIDEAVAALFLQAAEPPELELALAATRAAQHQAEELDRQWQLRLEQAAYAVRLAERRYKAVDPEHRVVARTLERDWEEALREQAEVQQAHDDALRSHAVVLTERDTQRVLALAQDLPAVWNAPTTTRAQHKALLRILVTDVCLDRTDEPEPRYRVQVQWVTGAVTALHVPMSAGGGGWNAHPPEAIERIERLAEQGLDDEAIAVALHEAGAVTGTGRSWSGRAVRVARHRRGIGAPPSFPPQEPRPDQRDDGLFSARGVANRFGVSLHVVDYWVQKGWLAVASGGGPGRARWFSLDDETVAVLEPRAERSWSRNPQADLQGG